MEQKPVSEALDALRRTLSATDEALAALAAIDQMQSRFDQAIIEISHEPEIWDVAQEAYKNARQNLNNARGCLEELQTKIAETQSPALQWKTWAESLVGLNEKFQSQMNAANQQATRFYEILRPTLIRIYLENTTRVPRWTDTWPVDAEEAKSALARLQRSEGRVQLEEFDMQFAEFRWAIGWPQQRIASVVGLSQPAVASRLARLEALISLEVGAELVRRQAAADGYSISRWFPLVGRVPRLPMGEIVLESSDCIIQLDLIVAAGEIGTAKRLHGLDRSFSLDLLRLETAAQRQQTAKRIVTGLAVYYRGRGLLSYFTAKQAADTLRHSGRQPVESVLEQLREATEPARTPGELAKQRNEE